MSDQTDKNAQNASELLAMYEPFDTTEVVRTWGESRATQPTSARDCDKALRLMELLTEMYELVDFLYPNCHSNQGDTAVDSPSLPTTPTRQS